MHRQRADWQRWKCRVKCVRRRSQQARVLSASPAAGAGRHTWQCAQATPADVSLVSQLCVCVCVYMFETQTPTRTLCEESDLCNNPSPFSSSLVFICIAPLSHPPVFIATSIIVMDMVTLLSPRYDMRKCDITHMLSPWGWRGIVCKPAEGMHRGWGSERCYRKASGEKAHTWLTEWVEKDGDMLLLYFGSRTRENKSYGTVAKFFLNICGTAWFQ